MSIPEANRRSVLADGGGLPRFLRPGRHFATVNALSAHRPGLQVRPRVPPRGRGIQVTDQRGGTVLGFDRPNHPGGDHPHAGRLPAGRRGAGHLAGTTTPPGWRCATAPTVPCERRLPQHPTRIAMTDFTPNVESIRALNPDVVVQWSDAQLTAPLEAGE